MRLQRLAIVSALLLAGGAIATLFGAPQNAAHHAAPKKGRASFSAKLRELGPPSHSAAPPIDPSGTAREERPAEIAAAAPAPEAPSLRGNKDGNKEEKPPRAAPTESEPEILARIAAGEPGFEVLASRLPIEHDRIEPRWQDQDEWVVETYYRQMQAPRETWTGPALWRFRIEGEVRFRGLSCWQFVVSRIDDPGFSAETYYVTRDGYRLAGAMTTVQQNGKRTTIVTIPEDSGDGPRPVEAALTVVPFDLAPLGAKARVSPPGLDLGPPSLVERGSRARMPEPGELVGAPGPYLDVEYERARDGTIVRQRWSRADMRWPVVSQTETTLSFRRRE
jgi:hypothetical protein